MKKRLHPLLRLRHSLARALFVLVLFLLPGCAEPQATLTSIRVTIEADGNQYAVNLPSGVNVQSALQRAGITLSNLDRIEPASYTLLDNNDVVRITRIRETFSIKENVIPFDRQTVHNESLPEGQTLLVQHGVNGLEQVTYRQVFENEQEVSNTIFKKEMLLEPVAEILMVGVQKPFTPAQIPGKLVYLAGGNAWLMEGSTGSRRPILTTGDLDGRILTISPKGDWLLFTRLEKTSPEEADGSASVGKINSLWAIDLTSEGAKPVNLKVDNVIHFAAWVPGKGLTILYSTVEPRSTAPGWQANNDLHQISFAVTGAVSKREVILETSAGGVYGWWGTSFAFSPDGALLAYARPDGVGLVDLANKTLLPLVDILPFQTGSDWAWTPGLGWSADHSVLYIVTHAPKAGLESQEASPLFDLSALPLGSEPLAGGAPPQGPGPLINLLPQAGMFAYPVPSPIIAGQGFRVAYLQAIFPEQSDTRRYRLAVMDRDGSNRRTIFPPEDYQGVDPQRVDPQRVAWSPTAMTNGSLWLAVNYQGNLWLVDSETGETQQVTGDGLITRFDWK